MAERVKMRRLSPAEGQQLLRIVRRGEPKQVRSVVRWRRATMLLASAGGNSVPVIARLLAADEDTVRAVIHRFNEIGLDCLDPDWAGGRPRLLSGVEEDFVAATALTRPGKLGVPLLALVDSQAGRVPGRTPGPAGPHWPGGAAYPAAPAPDHVPAHLDLEGIHRPGHRGEAGEDRGRARPPSGPGLRVRRVRPTGHPPKRRDRLGPAGSFIPVPQARTMTGCSRQARLPTGTVKP